MGAIIIEEEQSVDPWGPLLLSMDIVCGDWTEWLFVIGNRGGGACAQKTLDSRSNKEKKLVT